VKKVFSSLFGRRTPEFTVDEFHKELMDGIREVYDPTNENDRIGAALLLILQQQLDLLGYEIGTVPADERFATEKCRGALLGTAIGVTHAEIESPPNKAIIDAAVAAFCLVYGDEVGGQLAVQTIREAAAGTSDVEVAADWAMKDAKGVHLNGGVTSAVGFYVACNGMI
jgi:hypothetical protein